MKQSINWSERFSNMAYRVHPPVISWLMQQALETPGMISLAAGFVDHESLPHSALSSIIQEIMQESQSGRCSLQYGTTAGDLELREILAQRLIQENILSKDAAVNSSQIIIGSGSQQLLYLASEALLDKEDIVIVEAPTYFVVLGVFNSRGARTLGIDTDAEGMSINHLRETLDELYRQGKLKRVKMIYLMSYSTNPTGITLSASRRKEIYDLLLEYKDKGFPLLLLEDGAYRELGFSEQSLPAVKVQDKENDFILYTESFSKSLSPGFRLGYAVGPKAVIDKMIDIKGNHDFGSSNLCQQILKHLLKNTFFDTHTKNLRLLYREKRDLVLKIVRDTFPHDARWLVADGGFYTWITLPEKYDTGINSVIFKEAQKEKVLYVPGALCYSEDRPESQKSSDIRLSFGMIDQTQLREGCERLGRAVSACVKES